MVADGRLYRKADLDAALARSKLEFDGPFSDRVGMLLARLTAWWMSGGNR